MPGVTSASAYTRHRMVSARILEDYLNEPHFRHRFKGKILCNKKTPIL